jgi:hypothetical protein
MTTHPTPKSSLSIQFVKIEDGSKVLICLPDKYVKRTVQALWAAGIPWIIWVLAQSPLLLSALSTAPKCVPPELTHVQPDRPSIQE